MDAIVLLADKVNADPHLDAKCLKRGDVADFMPAGLDWRSYPGIVEQVKAGRWMVVSVPDLTDAERESLLAEEPGDPKEDRMLQRRNFRLDINSIQKAIPNATKLESLTLTKAEVQVAMVQKERLVDPAIIGPRDSNVIGPK